MVIISPDEKKSENQSKLKDQKMQKQTLNLLFKEID
jgi:hypothetical protein